MTIQIGWALKGVAQHLRHHSHPIPQLIAKVLDTTNQGHWQPQQLGEWLFYLATATIDITANATPPAIHPTALANQRAHDAINTNHAPEVAFLTPQQHTKLSKASDQLAQAITHRKAIRQPTEHYAKATIINLDTPPQPEPDYQRKPVDHKARDLMAQILAGLAPLKEIPQDTAPKPTLNEMHRQAEMPIGQTT